jgi:hypothetical protein
MFPQQVLLTELSRESLHRVQFFLPATSLVNIDLEISGLLDLGVRVHSFHLLAALGKSVGGDVGRDSLLSANSYGRLGTKVQLKRVVVQKYCLRISKKLGGR